MQLSKSARHLLRTPFRNVKVSYLQWKVRELRRINEQSSTRIVGPDGPVVSLTSYGKRIDTVYVTIESIARGSLLPSELILWLDDEERSRSLPITLERLKERGLSVRICEDYGPHKKYYPYVSSRLGFQSSTGHGGR